MMDYLSKGKDGSAPRLHRTSSAADGAPLHRKPESTTGAGIDYRRLLLVLNRSFPRGELSLVLEQGTKKRSSVVRRCLLFHLFEDLQKKFNDESEIAG